MSFITPVLDSIDELIAWFGSAVGQTCESYCDLETADSRHSLVSKDGSLLSVIKLHGATKLVGPEEFRAMHRALTNTFNTAMSQNGYAIQVFFSYNKETVHQEINDIFAPAKETARRLGMKLDDLFEERIEHMANYCAHESCYFVIWTRPASLNANQIKQSVETRIEASKNAGVTPKRDKYAQNVFAGIPELRENHDSLVRSILNDLESMSLFSMLLDVHSAVFEIRKCVDPDVTGLDWRAVLPGDIIPMHSLKFPKKSDLSDVMYPTIGQQVIPRDGEVLDLRTCRIGDKIYSAVSIDLFPQDIQPFSRLFSRVLFSKIPWRISFFIESDGLKTMGIRPLLATLLSFASSMNPLITDADTILKNIKTSSDEAIVKLRVTASTWANEGEKNLLRTRTAELIKAMQGWGQCGIGEYSGDAFAGVLSSALGVTADSVAVPSVAPLSDVVYMLPFNRPASPWTTGAALFRSPDGKPWPYQPGSSLQTTWIDLIYARPGSGKSVLSNAINLALCLQGGIKRLPRIAVLDIGPSSSGLISLIKEALPKEKRHLAAYHRLRMTPEYAINPFDTQLGCRKPTPQDRSFLINFLSLLATPVGESKSYDGMADMAGMIVDELYKNLDDKHAPHRYTKDLEPAIDKKLAELNYQVDNHTSWWEIVDTLFAAGDTHLASMAQRYAMPLMADTVSICRGQTISDLYGKINAPTGEPLISAFGRMISGAVREYPLLSRITAFDLGEARVVSLDLDEVAKSGGDAADRQTAVMYMLGRYILARHFYLTEENVPDFPLAYQDFHRKRILEIREDAKRLVMDEFHRTSKSKSVRDQVVVDMREGRKWKVQVCLLSQSLQDFDEVMVEFATSVFIMDAGPKAAVDNAVETFGLSPTARLALETRVHGPRAEGATFLAQFSTKSGINTQLCTSTLGPIELWSFNTTAEDARIRNELYKRIGASETRTLLAMLYPSGTATKVIEQRLNQKRAVKSDVISAEEEESSVIEDIIKEIMQVYESMPSLSGSTSLF